MVDNLDAFRKFGEAQAEFVKAELDLATSFAQVAIESPDTEKAAVNSRNAVTGYNTVLSFMGQGVLELEDAKLIWEGLAKLEKLLAVGQARMALHGGNPHLLVH